MSSNLPMSELSNKKFYIYISIFVFVAITVGLLLHFFVFRKCKIDGDCKDGKVCDKNTGKCNRAPSSIDSLNFGDTVQCHETGAMRVVNDYNGNKGLSWYPSPSIAKSWNPDWDKNIPLLFCTNTMIMPDMQMKV